MLEHTAVSDTAAVAPPAPRADRWRRPWSWWSNAAVRTVPALVILVLGYTHRWMSDDGLIYSRTVRQILAGNGPVFNAGERAEASTSALWQWILAGAAFVTRADPALLAVFLGLILTAAGVWLAVDGAIRLHGPGRTMLPAGALVVAALPPVWDFATSGLETGLTTCWIAASWRALVIARAAPRRGRAARAVFLFGLGPLVRPDLTILTVLLLAAFLYLARAGRRETARLLAIALVLPAGYEVFRAGYYGELVPLPAISKDAASGHWARGVAYLADFTGPYGLWAVVVIALILADQVLRGRGRPGTPEAVVVIAPMLAGALGALYVVYIGGDFMHARMLLPPLFMLLLPVMAVPAGRRAAVPVAILAAWSLLCAAALRVPYTGIAPSGISNERLFYAAQAGVANPDSAAQHAAGDPEAQVAKADLATGARILVLPDGAEVPLRPGLPAGFALTWPVAGIDGVVVPLGDDAVDPMGLAYPLAAHLRVIVAGRAGHDKWLPDVWVIADYGDPAAPAPAGIDPGQLAAARRALSCGALAQIQDSARAPMTLGRFFANLWHAADDTVITFPADPVAAEEQVCPHAR